MNRKILLPIAAAGAGLLGAALRGKNLINGYEPTAGLPIAGDRAQSALIFLSVVTVVVLFLLSRSYKGDRGARFETAFGGGGTLFKLISVLTGAVMIVAGIAGLYQTVMQYRLATQQFGLVGDVQSMPLMTVLPLIPLWLLAVLTGGCFIGIASALARGNVTESTAAFTIVPMFWSCFDLIITFKDNGASPFVSLYAFELFAAIGLTYAFYSLAGFLYSVSSPSRFAFSAGAAVFFCLLCVGGEVVNILCGGTAIVASSETLLRYVCFLASGLWLLTMTVLMAAGLREKK